MTVDDRHRRHLRLGGGTFLLVVAVIAIGVAAVAYLSGLVGGQTDELRFKLDQTRTELEEARAELEQAEARQARSQQVVEEAFDLLEDIKAELAEMREAHQQPTRHAAPQLEPESTPAPASIPERPPVQAAPASPPEPAPAPAPEPEPSSRPRTPRSAEARTAPSPARPGKNPPHSKRPDHAGPPPGRGKP